MVVGVKVNLAERFQLGFEKGGSWTDTKGSRQETMVDRTVLTGSCQSKYGGSVWGGGYEETQSIYTTWPNLFGGFNSRLISSKISLCDTWYRKKCTSVVPSS